MRIGAYQFAVSADPAENMRHIRAGVQQAAADGVRFLMFPECAMTGYPGDNMKTPSEIDFHSVDMAMEELRALAVSQRMYILTGMAERVNNGFYNSAVLVSTDQTVKTLYRKRALWGWDADHFLPGETGDGTVLIDGFRIGIRICFEVRFPEYFRELYRRKADCAAVLFCDRSVSDARERYDLIRAHLCTRAVENVLPMISVNSSAQFQTAPTAAIDEDGTILSELPRQEEGLLIYDLEWRKEHSFGAEGRRTVSHRLTGAK